MESKYSSEQTGNGWNGTGVNKLIFCVIFKFLYDRINNPIIRQLSLAVGKSVIGFCTYLISFLVTTILINEYQFFTVK